MLRNRGVVLSREMIENNLWNYDYEGGTNIVDVYVGYLRKKMDTGFDKKLIHTVWGSGWVLRRTEPCRQSCGDVMVCGHGAAAGSTGAGVRAMVNSTSITDDPPAAGEGRDEQRRPGGV